jgi:hypothetical protein
MQKKPKPDETYDEKVDRIAKAIGAVVIRNSPGSQASLAALKRVLQHHVEAHAALAECKRVPIVWH